MNKEGASERRRFLLGSARALGLAATAAVLWGGHLSVARASAYVLRPPGALPEQHFMAKCIKCGICVADCPYDALILAAPGNSDARVPIGTPYFKPRQTPCYMCTDIPCAVACPTGALDTGLLSKRDASGNMLLDINAAKMGLATIDRETCIAYWGLQCDVCYRACPLIDKALKVQYTQNERTGLHAFLAPEVQSEYCTGCGLCEHVCITERASITVLPPGVAKGRSDARYVRSWSDSDEQRLEGATGGAITRTPRSERSPADYLNKGL